MHNMSQLCDPEQVGSREGGGATDQVKIRSINGQAKQPGQKSKIRCRKEG